MMLKSALVLSYLAALLAVGRGQTCTQVGFFRNPNDCHKFYRCVDLWQNGRELTIYHFDCPPGTVFDETVSVCNWPQLAAPCDNEAAGGGAVTQAPGPVEAGVGGGEGEGGDAVAPGGVESTTSVDNVAPVDNGESVILKPSFSFQCSDEGLYAHASDCSKFWLCSKEDQPEFEPELYICPDGYWFDDVKLRCLKKELVDCNKTPDLAKIRLEPQAKRLGVAELDSFFARWSNRYVIEV